MPSPSRFIKLIGAELEGSWKRIHRDAAILRDPSVRKDESCRHSGEAVSPPLDRLGLETWIRSHIPDAVNETCGFHIHVSLRKQKDYLRLTSQRFYALLLKRVNEWGEEKKISKSHHFWRRLSGSFTFQTPAGNVRNFCRKEFLPEEQLWQTKKGGEGSARHCHLNFCYLLHGTVELRLFPAWSTVELYISSLDCFLGVIEEFLLAEEARRANRVRMKIGSGTRPPVRKLWTGQKERLKMYSTLTIGG